ncbi:1283_t:CDS:2, partial [Cetraspora pellucida]
KLKISGKELESKEREEKYLKEVFEHSLQENELKDKEIDDLKEKLKEQSEELSRTREERDQLKEEKEELVREISKLKEKTVKEETNASEIGILDSEGKEKTSRREVYTNLCAIDRWQLHVKTIVENDFLGEIKLIKEGSGEVKKKLEKRYSTEEERKKIDFKVIEQIRDFDHKDLTFKQQLLVDELITSEDLKSRYKKYGLCEECQQPYIGNTLQSTPGHGF